MSAVNKKSWITMIQGVQKETSGMKWVNPLTNNVSHHIETSQLICNANQLTGFYMTGTIGR